MESGINKTFPAQKAAFSFEGYRFTNVLLNFNKLVNTDCELRLGFTPSGIYDSSTGRFEMTVGFKVEEDKSDTELVNIECKAIYRFAEPIVLDELPPYFFANSVAILYPYIRAFVSNLTLQANYTPLIIPTFNVVNLGESLRVNTVEGKV